MTHLSVITDDDKAYIIYIIANFIVFNPVIVGKCGHRGLRCDPNFYLL